MTGAVFGPHDKPLKLTREQLLGILEDLRNWISEDDSMEGHLSYEWSEEPGKYNVAGFLRFGNSMGQGSARVLQADPEPT